MAEEADGSLQVARPPGPAPTETSGLAGLAPAYFGMVMATGIVSLAAHLLGMPLVAEALFWLNCVAYVVLWLLNVLRAVRYPRRFFGDLIDHIRGPGFFTVVAATCVLGSQFVLLVGGCRVAMALWLVAGVLWLAFTHTIFTGFTVKQHKPSRQEGISGAWLLAVVATQPIAVLAADPELGRRALPAVAAAVHQGVRRLLLGNRNVVDPDAGGARRVASWLPPLPAALRPAVLRRGVPAGDVRSLHAADDRGAGLRLPALPAPTVRPRRARRLGSGFLGFGAAVAAAGARVRAAEAASSRTAALGRSARFTIRQLARA